MHGQTLSGEHVIQAVNAVTALATTLMFDQLSKIGRQLGDDLADLKGNFLGKPRSPKIKAQVRPCFLSEEPQAHALPVLLNITHVQCCRWTF